MCCLLAVMVLIGPRFAFVLWWIFGDRVDQAFDSVLWPLLLLIFLPWTGLAYLIVWSAVGGVSGWEWVVVAIGLVVDLSSVSSRAGKRHRARHA